MLREPAIAWCDSCAAPGHTMIDSIWRERRAMVDQMIALTPGLDFMLACRLEGTRQSTLAIGRRVRNLLFGR
jgi:hypothetical protein